MFDVYWLVWKNWVFDFEVYNRLIWCLFIVLMKVILKERDDGGLLMISRKDSFKD